MTVSRNMDFMAGETPDLKPTPLVAGDDFMLGEAPDLIDTPGDDRLFLPEEDLLDKTQFSVQSLLQCLEVSSALQ